MSRTLLLVGTRKGCFVLESDDDAAGLDACAGRSARAGPSTTPSTTPASGAIYAAAASEWHGSAVWRSHDLGETWALSSEGLGYGEDEPRKVSKVSTLAVADGRVLVGVEAPGIFESRDGGETWSLLTTLAGQPGSEAWDDPANQPPGHLGISAIMPDGDDASHFWTIVQGIGAFETDDGGDDVDAAQPRACAPTGRAPHEEVGFCVHRLVRSPADPSRMYQQNHVGMHRSDDGGQLVGRDHRRAAERVRLRRRGAPARPRHLLRDPARPRPRPRACRTARRRSGARATAARAGSGSTAACRSATRTSACCARRWRSTATTTPGLYFGTSTGQLFASADEGESWSEIAGYLPPIWSVEVAMVE